MKKPKKHHRKRGWMPSYWWQFDEGQRHVVVMTDDPRSTSGIVKKFPRISRYATQQIAAAQALIDDLTAGRKQVSDVDNE